jgi:hypothetical protein
MGARTIEPLLDVHGPYPPDMRIINPYSVAAGDPLAPYSFHARLQTHNGDNVPLGLYQDTSCTTPATSNTDPVAAWRDEITGFTVTFTTSVSGERPLLTFSGGVPRLTFDGVNDVLVQTASAFAPSFIHARVQHISGDGRVTTQSGGGSGGFRTGSGDWLARYGGSDVTLGTPTAGYDALFIQGGTGTSRTSYNGSSTSQPDDSLPFAAWAVGDYQSGGGQVIAMHLVALYFGSAAINTTEQAVMESYTLGLAP